MVYVCIFYWKCRKYFSNCNITSSRINFPLPISTNLQRQVSKDGVGVVGRLVIGVVFGGFKRNHFMMKEQL